MMKQTTDQQRDVTKFVYLVKRQRRKAIFANASQKPTAHPVNTDAKKNESNDESNKHANDPVFFKK